MNYKWDLGGDPTWHLKWQVPNNLIISLCIIGLPLIPKKVSFAVPSYEDRSEPMNSENIYYLHDVATS
jgi:hypothetical protein